MWIRRRGVLIGFAVDALRRHLLLEGLDDVGQTMRRADAIDRFEGERAGAMPWLTAISRVP